MAKPLRLKRKTAPQKRRAPSRAVAKKAPKKTRARPKPTAPTPTYFGLYSATVTNIVDPDRQGRIQVKLGFLDAKSALVWARLVTPYAGADQGIEFLPDVDSEVVVAFQAGDIRAPYIVGSVWNSKAPPPVSADAANNKRVWKSRGKSLFEFDDTQGAEKITLATQTGHTLVLSNATREVKLVHASGASIVLTADGRVQIRASTILDISASVLNVHSATASFDGIVKCTTLIASAGVVSPAYTPGVGNIS
jgi:uncharacterized protein involved in type VI secretion and phage assembly